MIMEDIVLVSIPENRIRSIIRQEFDHAIESLKTSFPADNSSPSDFSQKYISRQQFMEERNIKSDSTPWTWENQGKLTPYKFGKEIFYLRTEVDSLMEKVR